MTFEARRGLSSILIGVLFTASCPVVGISADETQADALVPLLRHIEANRGGDAAFSFDHVAYQDDLRPLPIGVFDSGIGGLTVLESILALDAFHNDNLKPGSDGIPDFRDERFIYLGDQANMPYGNYASAGKRDFLRELIVKDATFLLGRRYWESSSATAPRFDKPPVKAIVIACNTATAYGLQDLRAAIRRWNIPIQVIGVVEAGARGVSETVATDSDAGTVAVMATTGTCSSMAYPKTIGSVIGLAGRRVPNVIQHGSTGLAGAIEGDPAFITAAPENQPTQSDGPPVAVTARSPFSVVSPATAPLSVYGFDQAGLIMDAATDSPGTVQLNSVTNYVRYDVLSMVENYRHSGADRPITTIVLGCTHFPLVKDEILSSLRRLRTLKTGEGGQMPYHNLIAEDVLIVDPAEQTARELFRVLATSRLRRSHNDPAKATDDAFFISVPAPGWPGIRLTPEGAMHSDYKYGRAVAEVTAEDTRVVPLKTEMLPESSLNLIRTRLPNVWKRLQQPLPVAKQNSN